MVGIRIAQEFLMTPQEHAFAGSTPLVLPQEGSDDWYKPVGALQGLFGIPAISQARREKGYMSLSTIGMALGVRRGENEVVGFTFCELTPEGLTIVDPDLRVGIWDSEGRTIQGRSLTSEFQAFQREHGGEDLYLRTESGHPEHRGRGKEIR